MKTRVFFVAVATALVACTGARPTELTTGPATAGEPTDDDVDTTSPEAPSEGAAGSSGSGSGSGSGTAHPASCNLDPSAFDVPGNGVDDDCNGQVDDAPGACDASLALASSDAWSAAAALGLCAKAGAKGWGVVDAKYVRPDGASFAASNAPAYGLLPSFGVNVPLSGGAMLALSTGAARAPGQAGYQSPSGVDRGTTSEMPAGVARTMAACPGIQRGAPHDGVALELRLRVPSNARSISFAHQLFTFDYKDYVCSEYNDAFVVLMTPKAAGAPDGNVAHAPSGDPIDVSSTVLMRACEPSTSHGLTYACPAGVAALSGTGFEGHASTGWLVTRAPVAPGSEITLRFAIWDSGDGVMDSTVLVDAFSFSTEPVAAATTAPK